jgi:flagellar protein FlaG
MNTINPQVIPAGVQRGNAAGGERMDARSTPAGINGKDLPQVPAKEETVSREVDAAQALPNAVARLNEYIQTVNRDLMFSLDETSGESVISVVDRESSKVIRQIPAEVMLTLAQKLNNEEPLSLFSAQV